MPDTVGPGMHDGVVLIRLKIVIEESVLVVSRPSGVLHPVEAHKFTALAACKRRQSRADESHSGHTLRRVIGDQADRRKWMGGAGVAIDTVAGGEVGIRIREAEMDD